MQIVVNILNLYQIAKGRGCELVHLGSVEAVRSLVCTLPQKVKRVPSIV